MWHWKPKDRVWFRPGDVMYNKKLSRSTVESRWWFADVVLVDKKRKEILVHCKKDDTWGWLNMRCDTRLIPLTGNGPLTRKSLMFEAPKALVYKTKIPLFDLDDYF